MLKLIVIGCFWTGTAIAFLRPTPRLRRAWCAMFLVMLVGSGLTTTVIWPFFPWNLWDRIEPDSLDYHELWIVDASGVEWLYDARAVPPVLPTVVHIQFGKMIFEQPSHARPLADWLLARARQLQADPSTIRPTWWIVNPGLLPVGPAARETLFGWSTAAGAGPDTPVELVVRKRRAFFSPDPSEERTETLGERRLPWTGL